MPTCGCCKSQGQTIEHIQKCFADRRAAPAEPGAFADAYMQQRYFGHAPSKPKWSTIPDSKYALEVNGEVQFFELSTPSRGRFRGFRFLSRLVGHPGDFARYAVKGEPKKDIMARIEKSPRAAAALFGTHFTVCGACGAPLTDATSIAVGIGPTCQGKFS
jgi:hypothetical protein